MSALWSLACRVSYFLYKGMPSSCLAERLPQRRPPVPPVLVPSSPILKLTSVPQVLESWNSFPLFLKPFLKSFLKSCVQPCLKSFLKSFLKLCLTYFLKAFSKSSFTHPKPPTQFPNFNMVPNMLPRMLSNRNAKRFQKWFQTWFQKMISNTIQQI